MPNEPSINGKLHIPTPDGSEEIYEITEGALNEPVEISPNGEVKIQIDNPEDFPGLMGKDFSGVSVGYVIKDASSDA